MFWVLFAWWKPVYVRRLVFDQFVCFFRRNAFDITEFKCKLTAAFLLHRSLSRRYENALDDIRPWYRCIRNHSRVLVYLWSCRCTCQQVRCHCASAKTAHIALQHFSHRPGNLAVRRNDSVNEPQSQGWISFFKPLYSNYIVVMNLSFFE